MLLTAGDQRLSRENPERFTHAWASLAVLSLCWGLASVGLWGGAWKLFGDGGYYGIPVMPVAAVVVGTCLWMHRRGVLALGGILFGRSTDAATVANSVLCITLALALLGLRRWDPDWPAYLPQAWKWLCPMALYRVLILAPLWGAWAMTITCQFCKPATGTEPAVRAFASGCGPVVTTVCFLLPLAGTLLYFHFLGWWRLSVPAVTSIAAIAGGMGLARRAGGLNRNVLLAVNVLTQLAFILAYLASR